MANLKLPNDQDYVDLGEKMLDKEADIGWFKQAAGNDGLHQWLIDKGCTDDANNAIDDTHKVKVFDDEDDFETMIVQPHRVDNLNYLDPVLAFVNDTSNSKQDIKRYLLGHYFLSRCR